MGDIELLKYKTTSHFNPQQNFVYCDDALNTISNGSNCATKPKNSENFKTIVASEDLAVSVQCLSKSYEKGIPILWNLSMNVMKGTIYGLLGSSGCGKTTLLNSIVGLNTWDSGSVLIFNERPGSKKSGIPGRRLGYMPQGIALHDQLSIKETIQYYGRLYGMPESVVEEQFAYIVDFLQLPSHSKIIKDLSGGQKRRISLAITLIHSPELLILDEPTVGLDPVLRESIWKYLREMVRNGTTVIVTTHYIEEAKNSNVIGVLRKGQIIIEASPSSLLRQFDCELLEQAVLQLCRNHEVSGELQSDPQIIVTSNSNSEHVRKNNIGENFSDEINHNTLMPMKIPNYMRNKTQDYSGPLSFESVFRRIYGFSMVMWLILQRPFIFIIVVLFLPTFQLWLTMVTVGGEPTSLAIGIVNNEIPNFDVSCGVPIFNKNACVFENLSCLLINELSKTGTIKTISSNSIEEAYESVKQGKLWGYVVFPANFSYHIENLYLQNKFADNSTLQGSRIPLRMDMSSILGAIGVIQTAFDAFDKFVNNLALSCELNAKELEIPLLYRQPVYGSNNGSYRDNVTPVVILFVIFEVPMILASVLFLRDRKDGTLDRARAAGLQFQEIALSYFIIIGLIVIAETFICFAVLKTFFNFNVLGSTFLLLFMIVLNGICGLSLGFFMGIFFEDAIGALIFTMFVAQLLLLWAGILWPTDIIPWIPGRALATAAPTTLLCGSLKSVIIRGLGLTHPLVWPGIAVMFGYIVVLLLLSLFLYKRKYCSA